MEGYYVCDPHDDELLITSQNLELQYK
uniref:Uncharacterized protein n=1 Tax=Rhizophora mucronata TaxID=61149 RepID=A0A2P2R0Q4_RHIMU